MKEVVVKRWRLHVNRYRETKHTHRYIRQNDEKEKSVEGKRIREVYVSQLALQGRGRDDVRGASTCAASQQKSSM